MKRELSLLVLVAFCFPSLVLLYFNLSKSFFVVVHFKEPAPNEVASNSGSGVPAFIKSLSRRQTRDPPRSKCESLFKRSEYLSPLAPINQHIIHAKPPLSNATVNEILNLGCGLEAYETPLGQRTWKEGGIFYIPFDQTDDARKGNVKVYKADYEPYVPYDHNLFFEGREHPIVEYEDRKILLIELSGMDEVASLEPLKACPDLPCLHTTNWNQSFDTAAAVSFNAEKLPKLPTKRAHRDQVFIFYMYEPIAPSWADTVPFRKGGHGWNGIFNWTMSYHLTSDILMTYGFIRKRPVPVTKNYTAIVEKKTKMAAWFVSHCHVFSQREKYIKELQKYIPVDVYGLCGSFSCSKENDTQCFNRVSETYKFYLSFENSICDDYVSEKFFRLFKSDLVIVARGNTMYNRMVPDDVYIKSTDFPSPKALADKLKNLDRHDDQYIAMLRRKDQLFASYQDYPHYVERQLWVKYTWENVPLCEVCQRVWNLEKYKKTYSDIGEWFEKRKCRPPTDLTW